MLTPTPLEELLDLAADVIGCDRRGLPAGAAGSPFITLGGGLGQAVRLQARAEQQLGLAVDLAQLLGPAPLADVQLAVQIARHLGAAHVVAAGRDPERLAL
ncbi:hypothetical protein ABT051_42185, partial [Streptomyces sp. NPDC002769]